MRLLAIGAGLLMLAAGGEAAAQAGARGSCTSGMRSVVDAESFAGAGGASARQLEDLRRRAEQRFRAAADRMCGSGELRPALLRPFRRLLVQYGGGASETTVYVDRARPATMIFQYAFEPGRGGRFDLPAPDDIRDGLRCWAAPQRHRRMCAERMP